MGLRDFLFGSDQPDDLEQAFATGEIDAETYQEGLKAKAKAEAQATAEKQKALQEAQQSRSLQAGAKPSTHAESNGYQEDDHFSNQDLGSSELQEIKEMRESGGIISQWVHARALLEFGTGAEFESEEDELAEYLNDELENLDNLLISLGEDAIWYPRSYAETVETRGGDFSHVECIEPWTMDPTTDQHGEITRFTQEIQNKEVGTFSPDEIGYFILNKSSGRDKLGISQVWRAKDEIQTYLDNKNSVANAIELAGFPHVHWQVGAEDSMIINDNELRRVRNIVGNMDSDSQIVTGTDVDHEVMEPTTFDFTEILTHDARQVATALGVPIEVATVISEGLGSGEQSNFRRRWFESQAKADRRMLSGQFIEQVAKPILIEYGGFSEQLVSESNIHIEFGPLFEDDNTSDMLNQIGEDLTVNERRAAYDKEPLDDEEVGESYDTARGETTEEGEGGGPLGGEGGLFSEAGMKRLAVPDNAVSIDDRSEAPDDAQIVTGERGGLYYVPAGEGDTGDAGGEPVSFEEVEEGDEVMIDATIEVPEGEVDISDDPVEITQKTEFGVAIDHPEHGTNTIQRDNIGDIQTPGESDIADPDEESDIPDPTQGTQTEQHTPWEEDFSLENSVDEQSLADLGVSQGKTAENMEVHEFDDGTTAFVKEFGEGAIDETSRDQTLVGYEMMKQLSPENVPAHAVSDNGDMVATEGVDGQEVGELDEATADQVDQDEYMQAAAAQVLMGNDDARPENVVIKDDGTPQFIDLDEAGDARGDGISETEGRDAIRRAATTWSEISGQDRSEAAAEIGEHVKALRDDVDTDAIEGVESEQGSVVSSWVQDLDDEQIDDLVEDAQGWF